MLFLSSACRDIYLRSNVKGWMAVTRAFLGALPWARVSACSSSYLAVTVICAAPGVDGAWWRAQVVASYEETDEVEIRYVDYGGYKRVKVDVLRQIR
jgi:hypothetical protein